MELVLSLFPGIDLLGRAFQRAGFCVVRGPDLILDERIEDFHSPAGHFHGIIGGPPCQNYSKMNRNRNPAEGDRLVGHFLRLVDEARPAWWLIENVPGVPTVRIAGYHVQRLDLLDSECGGKQNRLRHIQFGSPEYWPQIIRPRRGNRPRSVTPVVLTVPDGKFDYHYRRCDRQGTPRLPLRSLTAAAKARGIGNAVPWNMALALAEAVAAREPVTPEDCICLCGRRITPPARHATASCRKRMERRRRGHVRVLEYSGASPGPSHGGPTPAAPN